MRLVIAGVLSRRADRSVARSFAGSNRLIAPPPCCAQGRFPTWPNTQASGGRQPAVWWTLHPRSTPLQTPRRAAGVSPLFGGITNRAITAKNRSRESLRGERRGTRSESTAATTRTHRASALQASGGRQPAVWWTLQPRSSNSNTPVLVPSAAHRFTRPPRDEGNRGVAAVGTWASGG
jgi:hypothetical protein